HRARRARPDGDFCFRGLAISPLFGLASSMLPAMPIIPANPGFGPYIVLLNDGCPLTEEETA
ncbi:MAG TPA: hypothetical protein VGA34_06200, partial [Alteraurantiacibacter sp.]